MKKALIALGVVALLSVGSISYAMWGGGYGMMGGYGPGYGGHNYGMMGGYGPEMMRGYGPGSGRFETTEESKKFFEETADTRRELNSKRFELREAYRAGDETAVKAIEKDVIELREKLYEKSGTNRGFRRTYGRGSGYGSETCGGPSYGG